MDWTLTLQNSPYYLGAFLLLLLLILILRRPTVKLFSFLFKIIEARANCKKQKKVIEKEVIKVVKIEPSKKLVYVYWQRVLFFILGFGVLFNTYLFNWNYLVSKYIDFYAFILEGTHHKNATMIIITLLISFALLVLIRIIILLEKKKGILYKIIHYILFSSIAAIALIILIKIVLVSSMSWINSTIMGVVFILFGLLIKRKN